MRVERPGSGDADDGVAWALLGLVAGARRLRGLLDRLADGPRRPESETGTETGKQDDDVALACLGLVSLCEQVLAVRKQLGEPGGPGASLSGPESVSSPSLRELLR